jgi:tetratricopeptide (TPR) repeat protein
VYADFDIISGKGKLNYADLDTAVVRMKKAFDEITLHKGDITTAEQYLKDAIAIWEKALAESDPSNNKARINDDITAGLQYNIAVANIWMRKPDMAKEWLKKASTIKYGERLARNVSGLIAGYEKRWKANHLIE